MAIFTNMATLSYNGNTINSNTVQGELTEVLAMTKTSAVQTYEQGQINTYLINIVNSGALPYTGLTLTDNMGAYLNGTATVYPLDYVEDSIKYYIGGTLQSAPTVTDNGDITITGINVPAGENAQLIYSARVNSSAPGAVGGTVTNTASLTGDGLTAAITAEETITAEEGPRLSITKVMTPTTVTENGQVTYTFIIQNIGNTAASAEDNIVISDVFDPALTNLSVDFNGVQWLSPANYTYTQPGNVFSTTAGSVTVPAATFEFDEESGTYIVTPGVATVSVTGTV